MVRIAAVQFGFEEAARNLQRIGEGTTDLTDPLDEIVDDITEIEEKVFSSQGRRGGGMWKLPTLAWQRRKNKAKRGASVLVYSKRLRKSVTYRGNPDMFLRIDGRAGTLQFGSRVPYARAHQRGEDGMPQRKFIKFVAGDRKKFAKKISKFVVAEFKGRARQRKS